MGEYPESLLLRDAVPVILACVIPLFWQGKDLTRKDKAQNDKAQNDKERSLGEVS